ncbi:MAG: TolB family protein [Flagellimonas sp.]
MKIAHYLVLITMALAMNACNNTVQKSKVAKEESLEEIYLGQNPPGTEPELFAPSIIKTAYREAAASISPNLKEFYFRRRGGAYKNNALVLVQFKDNKWTESLVAPKSGEPFIAPDGKTMHLGRNYRERTSAGWSEVRSLGAPFDKFPIMRLTAASNGTYYFDEASEDGPLRYSRLVDGKHEEPKTLNVDVGIWNAHPFIAPDESYIIWDDQRESGYGDSDLYISFRQKDNSWGPAINLGDKINTEFEDAYGSISPDGKYFFFHRSYGGDKADIFWVDAKTIFDLKTK